VDSLQLPGALAIPIIGVTRPIHSAANRKGLGGDLHFLDPAVNAADLPSAAPCQTEVRGDRRQGLPPVLGDPREKASQGEPSRSHWSELVSSRHAGSWISLQAPREAIA
jgi:hypothetical protein